MSKGKSWVAVPMYLPHGQIGAIILGPVLGPVRLQQGKHVAISMVLLV